MHALKMHNEQATRLRDGINMTTALPLPLKISQQSDCTTTYQTLTAKYGDGYSEDRPDGINSKQYVVDIVYVNLSPTELASVYAFLDSVGGWNFFTWTNVLVGDITASKYKVDMTKGVKTTVTSGNAYNLSFTIISYFGF